MATNYTTILETISDSLVVYTNNGGGDCLLYPYLQALMYTVGNFSYYYANKRKLADSLRHSLSECINFYPFSREVLEKNQESVYTIAKNELSTKNEWLTSVVIPLINSYTGLSCILIFKQNDTITKDEFGKTHRKVHSYSSSNHINTTSNKYILIHFIDNHYELIGTLNKLIFDENDPIIKSIKKSKGVLNGATKIGTKVEENILLKE